MSDALDDFAGHEAIKTVVVTGAGDVFSAGFDLREFQQPELTDQLWASSDRFHATVLRFPLPVVAAVNGPAIAGGFDLAVMSDVRVAADTARFSHPEIEFGDVVYGPLHDIVGGGVAVAGCASRAASSMREEAKALGLVSSVVPVDDLGRGDALHGHDRAARPATCSCARRPRRSGAPRLCGTTPWTCKSPRG